jgi:tetratricopeptide (TPR) repeat protein
MTFISIPSKKASILFCLLFTTSLLMAQQKTTISGVVSSADGPIQGATITVKNTFNETITDKEGVFTLKVTEDDSVLQITSFTMNYKEVSIDRNAPMKIVLDFDGQLLDEIVLSGKGKKKKQLVETAYGKQNRDALGYSTSQELKEEDIKDTDITVFDVLRKMPGVEIYGNPGINQSILFTKNKSITSQPPGVVIDGVLLDQSILNTMSPNEIASIKLLKGLNATLKYGQLGSGGIILITTKLGKGNVITAKEKVKSLQVKGNEYTETVTPLEAVNTKSATVLALEKLTTFEEAKALYESEKNKAENNTIPFYIETSDYFLRWDKAYSFKILSTIAKLAPNNTKALKAYAYKLEERGEYIKVVSIYNRILALRPESAQAYRDLALACEAAGDYETAFSLFYQIVYNTIPNVDCSVIQQAAYNEFRHLLAFHKSKVPFQTLPNEMLSLDYKHDIRIVFEWTQADVDFDVQFVSPDQKFFNWTHTKFNNKDLIKEELSKGFALKEQIIDDADKGNWLINTEFFEDEPIKNPTFLKYTLFQDYGLPTETKTTKIIPMKSLRNKATIDRFINK